MPVEHKNGRVVEWRWKLSAADGDNEDADDADVAYAVKTVYRVTGYGVNPDLGIKC